MYHCQVTSLLTLLRWRYVRETPAGGASTPTSPEVQQKDIPDRLGSVCCGLFATQTTILYINNHVSHDNSIYYTETHSVLLFCSLLATVAERYLH